MTNYVNRPPQTLGKAYARVHISQESFDKAETFLRHVDLMMRTSIVEKALRKAAAPVETLARQTAPDSIKSGSRKKWSRKMRAKRAGTKQHKETIGHSTVRNYNRGLLAIYVGPIHPAGNLINVIGHQHRQILWGVPSGAMIEGTKYLKEAGEQTVAQQNAAFVNSVKSQAANLLLEGMR